MTGVKDLMPHEEDEAQPFMSCGIDINEEPI